MKKKLLALLGGTLLTAMVLTGCAGNDQDPPPEEDVNVETPNNGDVNDNNGAGTNGDNGIVDDQNMDESEDQTGGGDLMQDSNEEGEDMVEDQKDMNDKNNQDK